MAEGGPTKLAAVQEMMRAAGYGTPANLDTNGSSEEANAERILDEVTEDELTKGYRGNFRSSVPLTAADVGSGVFKIDLPATVLRIDCTGPGRYKGSLVSRGGFAYNYAEGTDDFGSAVTVNIDIYDRLAWADIAPDLKQVILKKAKMRFTQNYSFDPRKQAELMNDKSEADLRAQRVTREPNEQPNTSPVFAPRPDTSES